MFSNTPIVHAVKRTLMHLRRRAYGLRAYIPGLREHHRLEAMVGPLGFWHALQRYHLQLLTVNGLKPHHTLLDIGCGPLQGGVAFIRYLEAGKYTGLDIDPLRIDTAKRQVLRYDLTRRSPELFVSSSFGQTELSGRKFDFMWASQILYYFDEAPMHDLLTMIAQRLAPDGKFLGDVFALDHYEFKYPENRGKYIRHTDESLQKMAREHGLQARCLGPIEKFGYPRRLSLRTNLLFEITR